MKPFAQIRGDEILHLSYNQRAEEIERLNKHIDTQAAELERYETARQEDARRLEQVEGERDRYQTMHTNQLDYSIALQRAIEYHSKGKEIPADIAKDCPHHADMLNAALKDAK